MNIPASIKRIETNTEKPLKYNDDSGMNIPASIKRIETEVGVLVTGDSSTTYEYPRLY